MGNQNKYGIEEDIGDFLIGVALVVGVPLALGITGYVLVKRWYFKERVQSEIRRQQRQEWKIQRAVAKEY